MRIGIDARFFGPASGGLGRYTSELINNLLALDASVRLTLFLRPDGLGAFSEHPGVERVLFPFRWYTVAEQLRFPRVIRQANIDVMHFPHFNVPLASPRPFVVTIHDLILHDFPTERATTLGPLQYWMKRQAYHFVIRRAVERAEQVLTISQFSKENIIRHFGTPPDRITVTYEGPSRLPAVGDESSKVLDRFSVRPGYVLYVGNSYPHKNLETLLKAWLRVRSARPDLQLVLVGKDDYFSQRLQRYAASLDFILGRDVIFPGFLNDHDLASFYQHARLYVFPSLAEGFGLPGLEAMAHNVPVAASRASCLPEVFADAAAYFDPKRSEDIARVILDLVGDEHKMRSLREAGQRQVQKYSWRRLALETLTVYRSVVEENHGRKPTTNPTPR